MYHSMLGAAVDHLEYEIKYLRETIEEQKAVIAQLHRGYPLPGEPTLIHPYDMAEIVNRTNVMDILSFPFDPKNLSGLVTICGTRYKQTPFMPQIGNSLK